MLRARPDPPHRASPRGLDRHLLHRGPAGDREDVATGGPRVTDAYNERRLYSALEYLGPGRVENRTARARFETAA
jgi:hypothetical protein